MSTNMIAARAPILVGHGTMLPKMSTAASRLCLTPIYNTNGRSPQQSRHLSLAARPARTTPHHAARPSLQQQLLSNRQFSTTTPPQLEEKYFPEPKHNLIRTTRPAWEHPGFTEEQMTTNIRFEHRIPEDMSDRFALFLMRILRKGTDIATGYSHDVTNPATASDPNALESTKPYHMSERKWLIRFLFLESVAGVPGMVAGMLRHLRSLRRMQRDNGWIETLLEEAYNERMHLLTFLKMAEPGWFMRLMCLGAQGVFFNSMFLGYLISPRTAHRFVGYLEEEAVLTYSLVLADLEAGKLPKWEGMQAPDIAIEYWKMPEGKRTVKDLILYVRADEAKHREVNHTLGNLKQEEDPNPFVSTYFDAGKPHPGKGIKKGEYKGTGWARDEVI
ncbi:inducible alternative oxidase 2 [Pseudogymnoascus australis]